MIALRRCLPLLVLCLGSCVYPRLNGAATPGHAFNEASDAELITLIRETSEQHPGDSGLYVLGDGVDAFAARISMVDRAVHALDAQYYIFHQDVTGSFLLERLLAAADRGVRVRLLLDDLGSNGIDDAIAAANVHENLEVRLFNPRARGPWSGLAKTLDLLSRPFRLNHRMHNKMLTSDGVAGIVGGRNVGDEYFDASADVNFGDLDLLAFGPVVTELGESFDSYWNSEFTQQLTGWSPFEREAQDLHDLRTELAAVIHENRSSDYAARLRDTSFLVDAADGDLPLVWAPTHAYSDLPRKIVASADEIEETLLIERLRKRIDPAKEELLIVSPYFIPGEVATRDLVGQEKGGVEVRILTNSLAATDVPAVHAGYRKYRRDLVEGGAEIFEAQPESDLTTSLFTEGLLGSKSASLHAKTFIVDRRFVFVGSMNLDPRSVELNTELGFVIESPELAELLIAKIERVLIGESSWKVTVDAEGLLWTGVENGLPVEYRSEPRTSCWQRFKCELVGLLPVEGQL